MSVPNVQGTYMASGFACGIGQVPNDSAVLRIKGEVLYDGETTPESFITISHLGAQIGSF